MKSFPIAGFSLLLAACVARGQDRPLAPVLSFEVASIRPSQPGPDGWMPTRVTFPPGAQRFTAVDVPLRRLIATAHDITDRQIAGESDWVDSKGFDLEAKTQAPTTHEQMLLMLRSLLSDRFGLTLRGELKEMSIEALSLSKHNLKLQPAIDPTGNPRFSFAPETSVP